MRSYTAPLAYMKTSFPHWLRLALCLLGYSLVAAAQQADALWPADRFLDLVLAKAGAPATISLTFNNRSSVDDPTFRSMRRAVEVEARNRNLRIVSPENAIAQIRVTISENVQGLLWIGEVKEGLMNDSFLLSVPPRAAQKPPTLNLHDAMIWSQPGPILDFAIAPGMLVALTPEAVLYMVRDGATWRETQRQPLHYNRILPRDLRGKLTLVGSAMDAYLPGIHCSAPVPDVQPTCAEVDDPWPLDSIGQLRAFFSANRNYFTGALSGVSATIPPFYSAARTSYNSQPAWVVTGTDGTARLYSDWTRPLATFPDWGSDVASLKASCESDQWLVSRPGDSSGSDAIQGVELTGLDAGPSTSDLRLPGPVLSLSSSTDSVNAVIHNSITHRYEAHVLTITCD